MRSKITKYLYTAIISVFVFSLPFSGVFAKSKWGDLAQGVATGMIAGFTMCYGEGAFSSSVAITGDLVDEFSVPTNPRGLKMINKSELAKECSLDYVANALKTQIIEQIIKDTTDWVKRGFHGKPAFITNPDQFLYDAMDKYVGQILEQNDWTRGICEGQELPLKYAINLEFNTKKAIKQRDKVDVPKCTFTKFKNNLVSNVNNVLDYYRDGNGVIKVNNFWDDFEKSVQINGGNTPGLYIWLSDDLNRLIGEENKKRIEDVNRNGGFMSIERCYDADDGSYSYNSNQYCANNLDVCLSSAQTEEEKSNCYEEANKCSSSYKTQKCEYVTPGYIVAEQVSDVLGMENQKIMLADEFDELLNALFQYILGQIFDSDEGLADFNYKENKDLSLVENEKKSFKKNYNLKGYDLVLKIYNSEKKNIQNYLDYLVSLENKSKNKLSSEIYRWDNKNNLYAKADENNVNVNIKFVSETDKTIQLNLKGEEKKYIDYLDKVNTKIKKIQSDKKLVEQKLKQIDKVKSREELWNLFKYENGDPIDLPDINKAYNDWKKVKDYIDKKISGEIINYDKNGPIYSHGLLLVEEYLNSFNHKNKYFAINISDEIVVETKDSIKYSSIMNLLTRDKKNITDSYNPQEDINNYIEELNNDNNLENYFYVSEDKTEVYQSLISEETPSIVNDKKYKNWLEFFRDEDKIVLDKTNQKDGKKYLAFLKGTSVTKGYDPETKETYPIYSYNLYSILVNHFALYPDGLGDKSVDKIYGQGKYRTVIADDGKSWNSFKVYIPKGAEKVALLLKNPDKDKYLYRMHLTIGNRINHKEAKSLQYKDKPSDSDHYGLEDFFNGKTSLINILEYGEDLGAELEPGIYNAGIVIGGDELKKYLPNGGWMYVDIIKDNYARGEEEAKKTYLKMIYYLDFDRSKEEIKNWLDKEAEKDLQDNGDPEIIDILK